MVSRLIKNEFKIQDYRHIKHLLSNHNYCILSDNGYDNIVRKNELMNFIDVQNVIYTVIEGIYEGVKETSYLLLNVDKNEVKTFAKDVLKQDSIIYKEKNSLKHNTSFDLTYLNPFNNDDSKVNISFTELVIKNVNNLENFNNGSLVKCSNGNVYTFVFK